jgi:hypothetical protein
MGNKDHKQPKYNSKKESYFIEKHLKHTKSPDLQKDFKKKFNFKSANQKIKQHKKKKQTHHTNSQRNDPEYSSKAQSKQSVYNTTKNLDINLPQEEIVSSDEDGISSSVDDQSLKNQVHLKSTYKPHIPKSKNKIKSYNVSHERNLIKNSKINSSQIKLQEKIKLQKLRQLKAPNTSKINSPMASHNNSIKRNQKIGNNQEVGSVKQSQHSKDYRNDLNFQNKSKIKNLSKLKDDEISLHAQTNYASISSRGYKNGKFLNCRLIYFKPKSIH